MKTTNDAGPMAQIPYDLVYPILRHLGGDASSLCAVSLCSSILRHEAQRILFQDLPNLSMHLSSSHQKFLHTIIASPDRLALYVRVYVVHMSTSTEDSLVELLGNGLRVMRNLTRLTLYLFAVYTESQPWGLSSLLSESEFTLERFDCVTLAWDIAKLFDVFLRGQGNLRHLGVGRTCFSTTDFSSEEHHYLQTIDSTVCPQLFSIKSNWDLIHAFLPTHQITTLSVTRPERNPNIGALVPASNNIPVLSLPLMPVWEVINHLPKAFTSVIVLEIGISYTVIGKFIDDILQFTTVRRLLLFKDISNYDQDPQIVIRKLFSNFGSHLQCIDYQNDHHTFTRYTREQGATGATQRISTNEARRLWLGDEF